MACPKNPVKGLTKHCCDLEEGNSELRLGGKLSKESRQTGTYGDREKEQAWTRPSGGDQSVCKGQKMAQGAEYKEEDRKERIGE